MNNPAASPWLLTGINGVPGTALGVSKFGEVGSLEDVYRYHSIDSDSIVCAARDLAQKA